MSNRINHRRGDQRRTENGPRWETGNPGAGCNSTHVAKARRKWRTIGRRAERRTGYTSHKVWHSCGPRFREHIEEELEDSKGDELESNEDGQDVLASKDELHHKR